MKFAYRNNIVPPCGDCEKKGCGAYHDQCEKYKEFREKVAERKQQTDDERLKKSPIVSPYLKRKLRAKKEWKEK